MEIFGVGPLEFLLILVLALVIMGPQDMVGTARKLGQWVYRVVRSPTWRAILSTTQDLRDLPQKIVRDAGIEDAMKEVKDTANQVKSELNEATQDIKTEMNAATSDLSKELNVAAVNIEQANNEAKLAGTLAESSVTNALASGIAPFAQQAPADGPTEVWPEQALANDEPQSEDRQGSEEQTPKDPYVNGLETFAAALGGPPGPASLETAPETPQYPQEITQAMIDSAPPETAEVAQPPAALPEQVYTVSDAPSDGSPAGQNGGSASEPAPSWALGMPGGAEDPESLSRRMQSRMDEMLKSLEKLEPKDTQPESPSAADESNS